MKWIDILIKKYETILNDSKLDTTYKLYKALSKKHLAKGICKYLLLQYPKTSEEKLTVVKHYMFVKRYFFDTYLTTCPDTIYYTNWNDNTRKECMLYSIRTRLDHLDKMKKLNSSKPTFNKSNYVLVES